MNIRQSLTLSGASALAAIAFLSISSCGVSSERKELGKQIEINELMVSNRTGLLNDKHKASDWIEIKNTSKDSLNLEGFELTVIKPQGTGKSKNKKSGDEAAGDEELTWEFPDITIGAGECLLIFADKGKSADSETSLSATFKLPKEGATVQFKSPDGEVLKEVKYADIAPDQSFARQTDGSYKATYWQSPGFDNDRKGYEAAMLKMEAQRNEPLVIWELMSRESTSSSNWVELKNVSDKPVDLGQYQLSKKLDKNAETWRLPARSLQPGEIISIQLAGDKQNPGNPLQAPLKTGDSETIVLSKDGNFVDGVCAKMTPIGGSIGRMNGKKGFFYFTTPTRNAENGSDGRRFIEDEPEFDKKPGAYADNAKLTLHLKKKGRKVHYTLDGSAPTNSSPVLNDSIVITKATTIRTFTEGDSTSLRSRIATMTYLPGAKHTIPVMNITVANSDLYDYNNGIYVEGPGYTPEWPHVGANYWKKWTKKAHVELFDGKEGLSTDCGLRIFGGFSRAEAKKSFRLKFRGVYGDAEVDYDFFGNGKPVGLKDLVLRSGSQDWNRCMIRDEFFTSLMKQQSPTLLIQEYRPVALYVNGKYFGLYYMREKIDKNFVARKLNVPNDSINIIMSIGYNEEGPKKPYTDLIDYVQSHDMKNPDNYNHIKNLVDLQGLIDYKLGEMYSGNTDLGNIRYVRSTSPESDKKWHFIFYDLDASWVGYKPAADHYLTLGGTAATANVTRHNILINRLLENPQFRDLFLQRLSHHMSTTFTPENTKKVFDNLVETIRPEMKLNCERWPNLSYEQWEKNIGDFRKKFDDKHKVMLNELRAYLKITDAENKKYFSKLGY